MKERLLRFARRSDFLLLAVLALPALAQGLGPGPRQSLDLAVELENALAIASGNPVALGPAAMGASFGNLLPLHLYVLALPIALGLGARGFFVFHASLPFLGVVLSYAWCRRLAGRVAGFLAVALFLAFPRGATPDQHESLLVACVAASFLALDAFERRGRLRHLALAHLLAVSTLGFQAFGLVPLLATAAVRLTSERAVPWRHVPALVLAALLPLLPTLLLGALDTAPFELVPLFVVAVVATCRGRRCWRREALPFAAAVAAGVGAFAALHLGHGEAAPHLAQLGPLWLPAELPARSMASYAASTDTAAAAAFVGAVPLAAVGALRALRRRQRSDVVVLLAAAVGLSLSVPLFLLSQQPRHLLQLMAPGAALVAIGVAALPALVRTREPIAVAVAAVAVMGWLHTARGVVPPLREAAVALGEGPAAAMNRRSLGFTYELTGSIADSVGLPFARAAAATHGTLVGWGALHRPSAGLRPIVALETRPWRAVELPETHFYLVPGDAPEAVGRVPQRGIRASYLVPFEPTTEAWQVEVPTANGLVSVSRHPPFVGELAETWEGPISELLPALPRATPDGRIVARTERVPRAGSGLDLFVVVVVARPGVFDARSVELLVDDEPLAPLRVDDTTWRGSDGGFYTYRLVFDLAEHATPRALTLSYPTETFLATDVHDAHRSYLEHADIGARPVELGR